MFIVYTMPNCPDCKNAKDLLDRKGLKYLEKVAGRDFTRDELIDLLGPVRTLPQITRLSSGEQEHIGGYKALVERLSDIQ